MYCTICNVLYACIVRSTLTIIHAKYTYEKRTDAVPLRARFTYVLALLM
jgi:hypothetical protein